MSKQPPPAPTASAVGTCPTVIQIVGRPGTESLPSTTAPPDLPRRPFIHPFILTIDPKTNTAGMEKVLILSHSWDGKSSYFIYSGNIKVSLDNNNVYFVYSIPILLL